MKKITISLLLAAAVSVAPAIAADTNAAAPSCGKTVQECQKVVDGHEKKILELSWALSGAVSQRNLAATAILDAQVDAFVKQNMAPKTPTASNVPTTGGE